MLIIVVIQNEELKDSKLIDLQTNQKMKDIKKREKKFGEYGTVTPWLPIVRLLILFDSSSAPWKKNMKMNMYVYINV